MNPSPRKAEREDLYCPWNFVNQFTANWRQNAVNLIIKFLYYWIYKRTVFFLSETVCFCPRQLCPLQQVCVCSTQSASVENGLCQSEIVCVRHIQSLSFTDNWFLSQTVCACQNCVSVTEINKLTSTWHAVYNKIHLFHFIYKSPPPPRCDDYHRHRVTDGCQL